MDATREAERILDTVWVDIAGDRVIPVDPARIATELGIDVFASQLDPDVSAAILKRPGRDAMIILNSDDSPVRQRFSCAHELGHYVRNADDPDKFHYVDYRDGRSAEGTNQEEIFANAFAAALLMPEREVRARARRGVTSVELARAFRVSQDAMSHRLKNLGIRR